MRTLRFPMLITVLATALLLVPGLAGAQRYPSKSIRLIVPYAAGGPTDVLARSAAQRIGAGLGGTFVVENRPGTGTIPGAELVAKSEPDGYTLLLTTATAVSINQHMFKTLPYSPEKDFVAVGMLAVGPYGLFAHPSVPANTLGDLIAYAKANPGKLNVGIGGVGTPPDFAVQQLQLASGAQFTTVPYKGTAPAMSDLMDGRIQLVLTGPTAMLPYVKSGKLKALAMTSAARYALLPDVPTVGESFANYEAQSWYAFVAPAKTPRDIVVRVNAEMQKFINDPAARDKMLGLGMVLEGGTPEQLASYIKAETERWGALIKRLGLKPQ